VAQGCRRAVTRCLILLLGAALPGLGGCGGGASLPEPGPARGWNLLLITLDTVRADHLGAYGSSQAETPHLDALAARGLRFEQAWSAVPLTLPSHASILSGLLPPHHGLHQNGAGSLPEAVPTLASTLAAAGYRTGAFVGAFVLDRRFGLARGFDIYDDEIDRAEGPAGLEAERPGHVVVDRALAWLGAARAGGEGAGDRPFFAWVHLYDAHAPYEPPEPFASRHRDRPYDGEIAAVDAEVGRLLAALAERGLTERTLVAVVADHGEALGEHGELTHGLLLYEPSLRVPFLLAAPGLLPAGAVVATPVTLVDLAPTLVSLLGTSLPGATDGHDLAPALLAGDEPAAADLFAETEYPTSFGWSPLTALRRGPLKLIQAPKPELYALDRDPGETTNRLAAHRKEVAEMAARLGELAGDRRTAAPTELDAATRNRLAALGYVSPAPANSSGKLPDPKDVVHLFRAYEEAHWALEAGRFAVALPALSGLVEEDPANPVFRSALGRAFRQAGDPGRAAELYRQAVAAAPRDPENWYNLAVTLREAGELGEAVTALGEALALDPDRPEALNALGVAHAALGHPEEARQALTRATAVDPRNPRAWNNLGNVLRDLGHHGEAEAAYRRATELAPGYADPWNGLGTLEASRDRPREALPYFDKALSLDPALHEVRFNRAIALELAGQKTAAVAAYKDFLTAAAGDPAFQQQRQVATRLLARLADSG